MTGVIVTPTIDVIDLSSQQQQNLFAVAATGSHRSNSCGTTSGTNILWVVVVVAGVATVCWERVNKSL